MSELPKITPGMLPYEWANRFGDAGLAEMFPVPRTPVEVLTLTGGRWDLVPLSLRLNSVLYCPALPDGVAVLAITRHGRRSTSPDADPRIIAGFDTQERYVYGEATREEYYASQEAAFKAMLSQPNAVGQSILVALENQRQGRSDPQEAMVSDLVFILRYWESHGCLPPRDAFPQASDEEARR